LTLLVGCGKKEVKPKFESLDTWLEEVAFKELIHRLKTDSFLKGLPLTIVNAEGEAVRSRIDGLTEDIRDRLSTALLLHSEIRLVRRNPASGARFQRPYALQQLPCGGFTDPRMLLTIDIKEVGNAGTARINIRAIDVDTGQWLPLSLSNEVSITPAQSDSLAAVKPDEYLRGLKYVPFESKQADEMAAYLSYNLSCIFQEQYGGGEMLLYVDKSKMKRSFEDIGWVLEKRLSFCNEIRLVKERAKAEWVLDVEARSMDPNQSLWQVWIDVWEKGGEGIRGLATYAYFTSDRKAGDLSGTWWIYDIDSKDEAGRLEIRKVDEKGHRADLFGPNGELIAQGIIVHLDGRNVRWTYFDRKLNRLFESSGIIHSDAGTARITVNMEAFPRLSKPVEQELLSFRRKH
ncbi:hypothetical protein J7M28_11675, partial [bacterium]|nr:hypothetical protein [bacterium]